jgi:hypothetical protein
LAFERVLLQVRCDGRVRRVKGARKVEVYSQGHTGRLRSIMEFHPMCNMVMEWRVPRCRRALNPLPPRAARGVCRVS